jgi:alginate O-acetyltransferase complex protein AlgJ
MVARRVIAGFAIVFFALPLAVRAAGVTARPFENRALAPRPSLVAGWNVFDQTTRFLVDRMPLREQAVRAYSWTAQHVLDDSPSWRRELLAKAPPAAALPQDNRPAAAAAKPVSSPTADTRVSTAQVLRGSDGWLFVADDLDRACSLATPWPVAVRRLGAIARRIRRSGRGVAFLIPPDKSTIYPEHLDTRALGARWQCAVRGRQELWSLLNGAREPGVLGLRDGLLRAKHTTLDALFHRKDSHWNEVGASVALPGILERLGSGVRMRPSELVRLPAESYTGDLTVLLGTPEKDRTPDREIRRSAGAPRFRGRTLMLHDSFGWAIKALLEPYVHRLELGLWPTLGVDQMWEMIRRADRVVIEIVERELNPPLTDGRLLALLLDKLRSTPLPRRH